MRVCVCAGGGGGGEREDDCVGWLNAFTCWYAFLGCF